MTELVYQQRREKRSDRVVGLFGIVFHSLQFVFRGSSYVTVHLWLKDYVVDLLGRYSSYLNGI